MKYLPTSEYRALRPWYNDQPLTLGDNLNKGLRAKLGDIPLVEDLEVVLFGNPEDSLGMHASLVSKVRGVMATFPWYDHMESQLRKVETASMMDMHKSFLSDEQPYTDVDQGWFFMATADDRYQYILEGADEDMEEGKFATYFKADRQKYLEEWDKAIQYCKQRR